MGTTSHVLDEFKVRAICEELQNNESPSKIAERFGINRITVYRIKNGEVFGHISSQYDFSGYNSYSTPISKIHEICELLQEGKSTKDIVEITGIGRDTVQKIRAGEKYSEISSNYTFKVSRAKRNTINETNVRKVCEMIQNGNTIFDISNLTGIPSNIIQNIKYRISYTSISKDYNW